VPTHRGRGLPEGELATIPARPRDARNSSYFPLDPRNLADYDWLVALDDEGYDPGGPPLPG
jgi:hypothetical protein